MDLLVDDVYEIVDGLMYSFWFVLESDWAKFMIDRGLGEMLSEKKRVTFFIIQFFCDSQFSISFFSLVNFF